MTIRRVLMDIEGTIVPISFVRDVLFPYAQRRMSSFLHEQREDPAVRHWAALCQDTVAKEQGARPGYDDLSDVLRLWMEEDRKHTGLKGLQGMVWEEGYLTKAFVPHLYDDVLPTIESWRGNGLELALYSSGSQQAQRLFIAHTSQGDLTHMFSRFFDTRVGPKADAQSYSRIAEQLAVPPETVLYLSDVIAELDAASAAGMKTVHIVRPGTQTGSHRPIASTFRDVKISDQ
ncbi:enolase-phosphatase E1 [Nitrospira sp. KM1]|uniref:acireductone synthase n=1 Tax=Nitrospira sp. KM1 TaxID=1936990 RepID=UPI0013A799DA|nr:acireductone synthase [Nitrospira sp. KM1]BCA56292.1 enolase-phosphatase E1 [Nitrospira sp. KM1]